MNIAFRVDASSLLGSGHVMRCLTLANELKVNHKIFFICSQLEGNLIDTIKNAGFFVFKIPPMAIESNENDSYEKYNWQKDIEATRKILQDTKVDCLVIDHYLIEEQWETAARKYVNKIVVIDDLANRRHNCDILIDQNFYLETRNAYKNLIAEDTKLLLGEKYSLIRDEFVLNKKEPLREIKNIFVYFGASDLSNETEKLLVAYKKFASDRFKLEVLIGHSNPFKEAITQKYSDLPTVNITLTTNEISALMLKADISIGAGGSTTWERCCIGLPSVVIIVAENQYLPMLELEKHGVIKILSDSSVEGYMSLFNSIEEDPLDEWKLLQFKGMNLYDGYGKRRILKVIEEVMMYEC